MGGPLRGPPIFLCYTAHTNKLDHDLILFVHFL